MQILTMSEAIQYLGHYIVPPTRLFQGELGLKRMAYLLDLLDNPQDKMRVIHVAGTSGKGSTCYFISNILQAFGFKVGLTVSPHIVNIRERIQINNEFISEKDFCRYVSRLDPVLQKMRGSNVGAPTYFEILMAIEFLYFADQKVDYAVIETGMGGQFDASNTVRREDKVVVITRIGLDHTKVLGNTLSKIAFQKAKIIQKKNMVIALDQRSQVKKVINTQAKLQQASLNYIRKEKWQAFHRADQPQYQLENLSVALETLLLLSQRDKFDFDQKKIQLALRTISIPGRMQITERKGKVIVIDGAHNPQKMRAFLTSLTKRYPNQRFDFLIAFKRDKDIKKMIKLIIPLAKKIIATDFFVEDTMVNMSISPDAIVLFLKKNRFNAVEGIHHPHKAFEKALDSTTSILVVTGSLFLVSEVVNHI